MRRKIHFGKCVILAVILSIPLLCAFQTVVTGAGLPSGWSADADRLLAPSLSTKCNNGSNCPTYTFAADTSMGIGLFGGKISFINRNGTAIPLTLYQGSSGLEAFRQGAGSFNGWSSNADPTVASDDVTYSRQAAGVIQIGTTGADAGGSLGYNKWIGTATAFASLGTPANGTFVYCNDCTVANPCAGSGTGALAKRLNGAWVCN